MCVLCGPVWNGFKIFPGHQSTFLNVSHHLGYNLSKSVKLDQFWCMDLYKQVLIHCCVYSRFLSLFGHCSINLFIIFWGLKYFFLSAIIIIIITFLFHKFKNKSSVNVIVPEKECFRDQNFIHVITIDVIWHKQSVSSSLWIKTRSNTWSSSVIKVIESIKRIRKWNYG